MMKTKIHSLVIEGVIFCGSGLLLLSYSLVSHERAFNKLWSQSPYLFPLVVALAMIGISVWLMGEGVRAMKTAGADRSTVSAKTFDAAGDGETAVKTAPPEIAVPPVHAAAKIRGVVIVLALCACYYLALSLLKIPYVTVGILSFQYTFSTFEVATVVFLAAMMAYMGVRKPLILTLVPLGTTLFLSVAFRTLLHVLLP